MKKAKHNRKELIKSFFDFFEKKNHKQIPNCSLIPENDPTVLFTTAGMHPLVPFLLGQPHPSGKRLFNVQRCVRTCQDCIRLRLDFLAHRMQQRKRIRSLLRDLLTGGVLLELRSEIQELPGNFLDFAERLLTRSHAVIQERRLNVQGF